MNDFFGPITQLGHLTNDIEATARIWTETSGIGPWTRMRNVTMAAKMDGKDVEIKIDVALAYKDDMQIELIKPLCNTPSPYSENVKTGLWNLHHVQFTTKDMDKSLKSAVAAGLEPVCTIEAGGGKYTYLRGPGIWFELMEAGEGLQGLFAMIKASSENWDGSDLIRDFGL